MILKQSYFSNKEKERIFELSGISKTDNLSYEDVEIRYYDNLDIDICLDNLYPDIEESKSYMLIEIESILKTKLFKQCFIIERGTLTKHDACLIKYDGIKTPVYEITTSPKSMIYNISVTGGRNYDINYNDIVYSVQRNNVTIYHTNSFKKLASFLKTLNKLLPVLELYNFNESLEYIKVAYKNKNCDITGHTSDSTVMCDIIEIKINDGIMLLKLKISDLYFDEIKFKNGYGPKNKYLDVSLESSNIKILI